MIGQTISHFQILDELGEGGMGVVYKARDVRLDREVALKFILPRFAAGAEDMERFLREARVASMLNHPNICIIHDIQDPEGTGRGVFIVMELVDGVNLTQRIRRHRLGMPEVFAYSMQIAGALQAAHEHGIVHRDVKSENIMINSLGQVKIMDFGLAKAQGGKDADRNVEVIGTVAYMAPEVIQGGEATSRSDIFSFGVVLFEMLTGHLPFRGEHHAAMAYSILTSAPDLDALAGSDVPAGLSSIIRHALEKDPRDRYASMTDVITDLKAAFPGGADRPPEEPRGKDSENLHGFSAQLTGFVGREIQIRQIRELANSARLLTLTGPGGTGKTRLVLQAAREMTGKTFDRAYFVPLSGLTDPGLVTSVVSQALGVRESEGTPLKDAVIGFLIDRKTLLVLDSFEHLLAASSFVVEILTACPRLTMMITSREALKIGGECEYPVPPLSLPESENALDADDIMHTESVSLFVQRAVAAKPGFRVSADNASVIAAICIRLDGLPLAIELAAARVRHLTLKSILSRLDHRMNLLTGGAHDLPERQRTLRKTIEWSYDLLDESHKELFRRLAVFAGSFSLNAAEALCLDEPRASGDMLDRIASLVDKSLLVHLEGDDDEPRFAMLETIREFGLERLDESSDAASMRSAHAGYFLHLVEQARPEIWVKFDLRWVRRLTLDLDNIRESLKYFLAAGESESLMRLAGALSFFFSVSNLNSEGRQWLERTRSSGGPLGESRPGATVIEGIGHISWIMGDFDYAKRMIEESLSIFRTLGDECRTAEALDLLSLVTESMGDNPRARELQSQVIGVFRKEGRQLELARVLANAIEPADESTARAMYSESLRIFREAGHEWGKLRALRNLGFLEYRVGNYAQSKEFLSEALTTARKVNFSWHTARLLNLFGDIARCEAMFERASEWYTESLLVSRKAANKGELAWALCGLGFVSLRMGDDVQGESLFEECLAIRRVQGNRRGLAGCLIGLSAITMNRGKADRAVAYLRAVDSGLKDNPMLLLPAERIEFERVKNSVLKQAGEEKFVDCWQQSEEYTLDAAGSLFADSGKVSHRNWH